MFLLSTSATYSIYLWLISIDANLTLKIAIPSIVFIASFLGLWVTYKYFTIFIFQRSKLRGKMTFYFLIVSIGSIILVGGLMFYLIFLIEQSFIEGERGIAENIMVDYKELVDKNRLTFENYVKELGGHNPGHFPIIFTISGENIDFTKSEDADLKNQILSSKSLIFSFFVREDEKFFYIGRKKEVLIYRQDNNFYVTYIPDYLIRTFDVLKANLDSLYRLNLLKRFIRPISIGSLMVFSVPILIAVFFMSLFIARNISTNIEKIAKGTEIIASGNLNYRVKIGSKDEIEELARNFNLMAYKLKKATDQIKRMERLEAWQEVARRLAHEIKNPLTPIKLSAERLLYAYGKDRPDFGKILDKTINTIISETGRLETLVNEFSKFARLPILKLEAHDIFHTINDIIAFFQNAYHDFKIEVDSNIDSFILEYDEHQLRQVIINIITNSIEACKCSEDKEKQVILKVFYDEISLIIEIKDKSGGISQDVQDKIFEPYFTTKEHGTGLGLAIAERIILEHNGNIWFETDDEGTIFYIELPLKRGGD
jgi:signal transduction histidine kinase